jgi:alpha-tubulin suppressor-like RCC1 family protein
MARTIRPGALLKTVVLVLLLMTVSVGVAAASSGSLTADPFAASALTSASEVPAAPKMTKQPVSLTVEEGQSASFEATASGVPTPTVQWELSVNAGSTYSPIEGATSTVYTIASTKTSENSDKFRAVFLNSSGKATSTAVTLTVHKAPVVTKQPTSQTVEEGQNAVFEVAAAGFPAPTVQWELSNDGGTTWTLVTGGTATVLTVTGTKTSFSGRLYRATFKNLAGRATSEAATLTVRKAPAVTKQPVSVTVEEGHAASFEATASGFPAPTVQWQVSSDAGATWSAIEGATSNQLVLASPTTAESGNRYRAVFTNAAGEAVSSSASLTVQRAPAVTLQPTSATVEEGQSATFESTASGFPAPSTQWEVSTNGGSTWTAISGATPSQFTVASAKTSESGRLYRAAFTNAAGKATSSSATLTVRRAPAISSQPAAVSVNEGQSAVFTASASGFPAPSAQWEMSSDGGETWSAVEGATSNTLTIASATLAESGDEFRATFRNAAGEATTSAALLTVHAPPAVTEQPASTTVEVGQSAVFEAAATGVPPPTVQWEVSSNAGSTWSAIEGATTGQLTIASTQVSESGREYRAVFTSAAGKATTAIATLTVATNHYSAVAWGDNLNRQLGDGSASGMSTLPVSVSNLKFVTAVAAGGRHSLAVLANGTVVSWGNNEYGQLGDGTTSTRSVPVAVSGISAVKAIAAGDNHSLALMSNGTVMAWGDNESGQLGNGSILNSETPVAVKGLTGVKAVSAGVGYSLALLSNGTVMAWGANEAGQLGTGSVKSSPVPVAIKGLTGVAAVAAGGGSNLALLAKGTVEAWGNDEQDQLGYSTGEEGFSDLAALVPGLSGVTAIAEGYTHSLALTGAGTVMAWGENGFGELGNGSITSPNATPTAVGGLAGVTAISAGRQDSVALLGGGSLKSWGTNQRGTLGDGASGGSSAVPVSVVGISKVASVSAGGAHMLAFGEPKPSITGASPRLGPAAGGATVTLTGANFTGATSVMFGTVAASSFTVTSDTTATAVAPSGTGTVDIVLATPSGTSATGATDRYTYQQLPTVTKLAPKVGRVAGGTIVTITGTEFTGASAVSFGATPAASFTVNSPTSITAVTAAASPAIVNVTVTNTAGVSAITTKDHFSYAPTVESVTPNAGPVAGGTSVTVAGTGFALGSTGTLFKFGKAKATGVLCSSSTSCTMKSPAGVAGTVNATATVNKAISPLNVPGDSFTYS